MPERSAYSHATEAVAAFRRAADLEAAIGDLLTQGFERTDLGMLAAQWAVERKLKDVYARADGLEDRAGARAAAFIPSGPAGCGIGAAVGALVHLPAMIGGAAVVASGGALTKAVMESAGSSGLSLGGVLAGLLGAARAARIEAHLLDGGLLLRVRSRDRLHAQRALAILAGHNGNDAQLLILPSPDGARHRPHVRDAVDLDAAQIL